jgi:cytidylate kinase
MKYFKELQEGVYDPNIFKAFFLAGGPGSGKSYVVGNTTAMFGMRIVNSDELFEKMIKNAGMTMKMNTPLGKQQEPERDKLRDTAKRITKLRQKNYIEGRLGLIIDGTGKDYDKIEGQMRELQQLGYESHMIFVNTSLDVALERNQKRDRTLPEPIVVKSWNDVQKNIGKFSQLFKNKFIIMDNNDKDENVIKDVYKRVRALAMKKVTNGIAKQWIANELEMKRVSGTKKGIGRFT